MIRRLRQRLRRYEIDMLLDLPSALPTVYVLPDGAPIGDYLGPDWIDGHHASCGRQFEASGFVCTRALGHRNQHVATGAGEVYAVWPNETSSGGETTAAGTDAAAPTGEPSPPDDTTTQAAIAEALLDELAQALATAAIPGADIDWGSPAFRTHYRRQAEAVALAGWRPPAHRIEELA